MPVVSVVSVVSLQVTRAIHFGKRMELLKDPFLKKSIQKHLYAYSKKWKKTPCFYVLYVLSVLSFGKDR